MRDKNIKNKSSFLSLSHGGQGVLEKLWLATAGWKNLDTRRGNRHADRRAGVLLSGSDLRTRLAWDVALNALGVYKTSLDSLSEVIEYPEVVSSELDVLVLADSRMGMLTKVDNIVSSNIVNAGSHEEQPSRGVAETLYLVQKLGSLVGASILLIGADNSQMRNWVKLAGVLSLHVTQLCYTGQGFPADLRGSFGNGVVEVVEAKHSQFIQAISYMSQRADVVRTQIPWQKIYTNSKALTYVSSAQEVEDIITPASAAILEHCL